MSTTKRVQGDYNIWATRVKINGDLVVLGETSSSTQANSVMTDTVLTLNGSETGIGVTHNDGQSGLNIDRGQLNNATWFFSEAGTYWSGKINEGYINIRAALPNDLDDVVTKRFLYESGNAISAAGSVRAVQFKGDDSFLGASNQFFSYANNTIQLGNILVANSSTITTFNNNDLTINSSAKLFIKDVVKMEFQTNPLPPDDVPNTTQLFAQAPGLGGSGVYIVNSKGPDELVSSRRALWLGLAFS